MSSLNPLFYPRALRIRGMAASLYVFAGVGLANDLAQAQQVQTPFHPGSRSNVEVRHTPGVQVWPSTAGNRVTNAVGDRRTPPTIEKTANGVKATLNPSWFTRTKREVSASGKVSTICDDEVSAHQSHSHSKNTASTKHAALKKASRTPHKSR